MRIWLPLYSMSKVTFSKGRGWQRGMSSEVFLAAPIRIMNRDEVREMWNKRQVFLEGLLKDL